MRGSVDMNLHRVLRKAQEFSKVSQSELELRKTAAQPQTREQEINKSQ